MIVERTETGFRMTFVQQRTEFMTRIYRGYFHLISGIWDIYSATRPTSRNVEAFTITVKLVQIANFYMYETVRASDGEAFFAATLVGGALVESILMLACVRNRDDVLASRAWKTFTKKQKRERPFADQLLFADLGNLIFIGEELGWFDVDEAIVEAYLLDVAAENNQSLDDIFEDAPGVVLSPLNAVRGLHEARNLVHPGRCLRINETVTESRGKLGNALVYISLLGVLFLHAGDDVPFLDLPVPEITRKRLGWKIGPIA